MYICYTICADGQRYACSADSCVISFDRMVIDIALANVEAVAQNAEAEGAQIAEALARQGVPVEATDAIRENSHQLSRSADRTLRRSKLRAEAFITTPGQRALVCDVREVRSLQAVRKYCMP